jgi:hypothetical protein
MTQEVDFPGDLFHCKGRKSICWDEEEAEGDCSVNNTELIKSRAYIAVAIGMLNELMNA